ncbi:hypothetical protein F5Y16DRAFT_251505 [Xylariaceae sp. FL0255]|nr:hypothetical protein F5Y16DRAFT_251505 [Xylariaceae sp. FL0255]
MSALSTITLSLSLSPRVSHSLSLASFVHTIIQYPPQPTYEQPPKILAPLPSIPQSGHVPSHLISFDSRSCSIALIRKAS